MSRFHDKATALVNAWRRRRNGELPSKHAVIMCCAVAEHETNCGDAWNRSGNWGAIQRRRMTATEQATVRALGTPPPSDAFEQLHGDSSPINGRYQTWFWAFPADVTYGPAELAGDEAGAWKLIEVLLDKRPVIAAAINTIDVPTLALDMYHTHYYEGIHDPRQPGGIDRNVADYAHALTFTAGRFTTGLSDWEPGGVAPAPPHSGGASFDLSSVRGIQGALNALHLVDPPLKEDGVLGPKTREAIMRFQGERGLKVDGVVGPKTREKLLAALP
ncbi:MAG TPA: peptidoglycan-binding domain-containing protein [Polyangiaceae bacterium]|nr:peptidoglycan-binding domain-containing protein [Polyangiaceae bacterium]